MFYSTCFGPLTALLLLGLPNWALAQSASPLSKSASLQSVAPPRYSPFTSEVFYEEALRSAELRLMLLTKEYAAVNDQLRNSKDELLKTDDQLTAISLSIESFPDVLKMLQSSRVELMIDLAGLEARQKELLKQRDDPPHPNPQPLLTKELSIAQELVKINQDELKLLEEKVRSGNSSTTQVLTAMKELKLSELRLAVTESKLADVSKVHSAELSSLILDRAEKSARLALVEKLLKSTGDAKPLVTSLRDSQEHNKVLQSLSLRLSSEIRESRLQMEENRFSLEYSKQKSDDPK